MRISDWSSDVCSSDLFLAKMRIQFIRLEETGHRSTKRKLYRAERQSVGIAHLELAHTERLIVKRAGMVWEKLIIGDVLEPAKYRVVLGQVPIRLSQPGG